MNERVYREKVGALYALCMQWSFQAEAMRHPDVRERPLPEAVLDRCAVELGAILDGMPKPWSEP